jgi:transposase
MSKAYTSNLSEEEYELLAPLLPAAKHGGRHRSVDLWEVINAILYVLSQGCSWRNLPGDFPKWQTVYHYFRAWRLDGTWLKIHDHLYICVRISQGREPSPSEAIIDSQSVKSAAMLDEDIGFDAAKVIHGRKRFLAVDTLGLVLRAFVTAVYKNEKGVKNFCAESKKWARQSFVWIRFGSMVDLMAILLWNG